MSEQLRTNTNQERWLLIDSHAAFSEALVKVIQSPAMAIELVIASCASDALEQLRVDAKFNTVLIDLDLPDMSAITLTKTINDQYSIDNILVCSVDSRVQTIREALQTGAKGFVSKSQAPIAVINAVKKMSLETDHRAISNDLKSEKEQPEQASALSMHQLYILKLLKNGHANSEIAHLLSVSHSAVKNHIRTMYGCLGAKNRTDCVSIAQRTGLL